MYHRSFSLCSPRNSMLVIVDVQERLIPAMTAGAEIVFNTQRLGEAARMFGVPTVVSEQYPKGLGSTLSEVRQSIPENAPILPKRTFSVCGDDALRRMIDEVEVPKVVLCGVEGHVCVQQSALDLLARDREVLLVVDAAGSRFSRDYEIALRRMEASGVFLTTTESILFEWCETADHPSFKAVSASAKREVRPESTKK